MRTTKIGTGGTLRIIVIPAFLLLFLSEHIRAGSINEKAQELLRKKIDAAESTFKLTAAREPVFEYAALATFYQRRNFLLVWTQNGKPTIQASSLLDALVQAEWEGLQATHYHLREIESKRREVVQRLPRRENAAAQTLVEFDLLLTDAFLTYASHLSVGRIDPETYDPEWYAHQHETDVAYALEYALDSNRVQELLQSLLPPQASYRRLKSALAGYKKTAASGGWERVPDGPTLEAGKRDWRIPKLRRRLLVTGDLADSSSVRSEWFDSTLHRAVCHFQKRSGLEVNGTVNRDFLAELNVPVEERVHQLEINLERWRWLPQALGERYILINIANFELVAFEGDKSAMVMRAVVGQRYRRTPEFSGLMTYLVLDPSWEIPPSIAVEDKLPLIRRDPTYLAREKIRLLQGWGEEAKEIDPAGVDWKSVTKKNFNYRLHQEPGPENPLGKIKFMLPNKFNVYLHDTPAQELFTKTTRTFSSGCIRVEKPLELAEYLIRGDARWMPGTLRAAIRKGTEQTVRLPKPIPVHLVYWTAWVDEDGTVNFRSDIYGRDKQLQKALLEQRYNR
jgi:murein L,D-transpeptidase YcbB/YkuD